VKSLLVTVSIALTLLDAGCTMAPRYVRPETEMPPAWPEGVAYPDSLDFAGVPAVGEVGPDELYPDARLQQVLALALANNVDLRLAALNVDRVQALYKIQRADLLPSISASASGSRQQTSADLAYGYPAITSRYNVDVGVSSWELDLFGRVRSEKNQALEQYLATEEGRRGAELSLVAAVGQTWLQLAASREQLELAQSTLKNQRDSYDLIDRQFQAGLATGLDLRRAQTQVNVAEGEVAAFIQQEAQDRNALNLLAGRPVPGEMLPDGLDQVTPPPDVAPGLSSTVLLRRPDVMAAEHQLKAANAYIGVARASFFPRISLTALMGTASRALSGLFTGGSGTWLLSSQVGMPLFDLRTHGALKMSQAERDLVIAQYQKTIQTAFREAADALAARGTLRDRVAAQERLVAASSEAYDLAEKRYDAGSDSYLSVLDAQRTLYGAQQGLVRLRLADAANRVRLYAVLGGGTPKED
jgi:multidrug efflux system outer membrane protein